MKNIKVKVSVVTISIIAICLLIIFCITHKNKKIIGLYKLTWTDYSHPIGKWKGKTHYNEHVIQLCLDKSKHYTCDYFSCMTGDVGLSNYLSAGNYSLSGETIILIDQWNQTKIKLLKCKNSLTVLIGYRFLIGRSFEEVKFLDPEEIVDNPVCEHAWFFRTSINPIHKLFDSLSKPLQNNFNSYSQIRTGSYRGTSICRMEYLSLYSNHTFEYKFTNFYWDNYPCLLLKGYWKQKANILILSDSLVNNSYYLEYINDTLKSGFSIPGSSDFLGHSIKHYSQSFVLE
jgi:hypothetical protein